MNKPAIAIIGAGNVGIALAQAFVAKGESVGFDAVDCGDLKAARYLEPFAMTWILLAIKLRHGRRFAFARLQR